MLTGVLTIGTHTQTTPTTYHFIGELAVHVFDMYVVSMWHQMSLNDNNITTVYSPMHM